MSRILLLPLAAVLFAGCASDSTGPAAPTTFTATDLTPRAKVDRFQIAVGAVTWDLDRGLLLAAGFPAQLTQYDICGGTEILIPEFASGKENGPHRGVLHWNLIDRDATINVYRLPSDWDFDWLTVLCETAPFAVGTGRTRTLDNGVPSTSTSTLERVRTVVFTVQGIVTVVATGEVLRVSATDNTKIYPDGSLEMKANILLR